MRYIKLQQNIPIDYSIEQFSIDYPNDNIYSKTSMPDVDLLAKYNVYPLVTTNPPVLEETEIAEEGIPFFDNGEWHQSWTTRQLTEEEIDKMISDRTVIPVGDTVSLNFFASEEVITERNALCNSCPSYSRLKICRECGCIMPLKVKLTSAVCPIGKW
jgi:hypothetical protein